MTIYINGRFLTQPMTGVERYAYNICKAMAHLHQPFTIVCPKAPIHQDYDVNGMTIVHYGIGNSHFWEQCVLPFFFIGKKDYRVLSFTGLGSILISNKIMTVHDLSFLFNRSWFSAAYYWWYRMMTPLAIRTSRHIITVSQFSKQEIMRFYPFVKDCKISVVYGAVDGVRFSHLPSVPSPEAPFALAVSSIDPRKNFPMLVKAFKGIKGYKLYIVGKQNHVFSQQGGLDEESSSVKFLGRVSDDELRRLYNQAQCFIFPSIYEGFGLPLLEAMTCGCPVLASDIPVFREVCGEAAIYFDPYDETSIRTTIEQFLNLDEKGKEKLQVLGYEDTQRFSWEKSATHIMNIIHKKTHNHTISQHL